MSSAGRKTQPMGWNPSDLGKDEYLILSTQGNIRAEDSPRLM
jgi:hypothetical protein